MKKHWIPLESNPDVLNAFAKKLGVETAIWGFSDIWALDNDALAFMQSPTLAVIILFPVTPTYEEYRKNQQEEIKKNGQHVDQDVFFLRQTIGNACGTIGLLHALGNNIDSLGVEKDTPLYRLIQACNDEKDPEKRATVLENSTELEALHEEEAGQGQTAPPPADSDIWLHFACFVEKGGEVYELDGRKPFPINHGKLKQGQDLLHRSAELIQGFMDREPDAVSFTMIALGPSLE